MSTRNGLACTVTGALALAVIAAPNAGALPAESSGRIERTPGP
jgi:hypothetical protein